MRRALPAAMLLATTVAIGAPDPSKAQAPDTRVLKRFSEWTVYAHGAEGSLVCFATSQPRETEPKGFKRDPAYFYVSSWPKDGVKAEISLKVGYALKRNSEVVVTIGSDTFKLFGKDDKAFVGDPGDELKLIEAMKKGSIMYVQATPESGKQVKDGYSLIGVSNAIGALTSDCK